MNKWKSFLWLALLAAVWGPSFIFIKIAVGEVPPITLAASRVALAALLLYLVLRLQGRNLPGFGPIWKHFAIMGFVSNALPFVLFSWGEQYIDSALAAILNGTTPIFTILLAHFVFADDRISPTKMMGVLLGFGGLVILILPSLFDGVRATTWGLLGITVAASSYAVAIVYSRKNLRGLPPMVAPTAQLTMAAVYLVPLSLLVDAPYTLPLPSWQALAALFALSVVGTGIGFVIYYRLLEGNSATYLSMVTYLMPVVGIILGVLVLGEQLSWNAYAGCALILLGIMTVNGVFNRSVGKLFRRPSSAVARP